MQCSSDSKCRKAQSGFGQSGFRIVALARDRRLRDTHQQPVAAFVAAAAGGRDIPPVVVERIPEQELAQDIGVAAAAAADIAAVVPDTPWEQELLRTPEESLADTVAAAVKRVAETTDKRRVAQYLQPELAAPRGMLHWDSPQEPVRRCQRLPTSHP